MNRSILLAAAAAMVLCFNAASFAEDEDAPVSAAPTVSCEDQVDQLTQDLQKSKDLVGIWKDHVKTLTKERDALNRQLEDMRAQPAPAVALPGGSDAKLVEDLKYQVNELKAENQELRSSVNTGSPAPAPVDDGQLAKVKAANDAGIRAAQEQLNRLQDDNDQLRQSLRDAQDQAAKAAQAVPTVSMSGSADNDALVRDLKSQVIALRDENADLKRQSGQSMGLSGMTLGADERIQELQKDIERLRAENRRLVNRGSIVPAPVVGMADEDVARLRRDKEEAERAYNQLETDSRNENQKLKALVFNLQAENKKIPDLREQQRTAQTEADTARSAYSDLERNSRREIDSLNSKIAQMKAEIDRLRPLEQEIAAAQEFKQSAEDAYRTLEQNHTNELDRLNTRIGQLQSDSQELTNVRTQLKQAQADAAKLQQYIADLKAQIAQQQQQMQTQDSTLDFYRGEIQSFRSNLENQLEALSSRTGRRS